MKLRYKIATGFLVAFAVLVTSLAIAMRYTSDCDPSPDASAGPGTMKAVRYQCYGPPEVLEFASVEKPVPQHDQVLVRVKAAAVNPLDWHFMRGEPYFMRPIASGVGKPTDPRMGVDFSGTVEATGPDVTRFKPGDAVFGGRTGAFAEYVVVPENRAIVHKPANVSFDEAAGAPVAATTALQAVRDKGQVKAGQSVLINGASGGVGTYAVQIVREIGAEVTGVCSTRNVDMVRSLGADHVIDYKKQNYTELDAQYDVIIDNVGNHSLSANRRALKPGGRLVMVGGDKGKWIGPLIQPISALIQGPFVDEEMIGILAQLNQEDLEVLAELMGAGKMKTVIDRRFPLRETPEAIAYSETGRARGKIIVTVD